MMWNWKLKEWPHFTYDSGALEELERHFLQSSGIVFGVYKHVKESEKDQLLVDILSHEAYKTSEIEGEYLDRDSIQESIKKNLGLSSPTRNLPPAEFGISEMMVDLYKTFDQPLNDEQMFQWHKMLTNGRRDLLSIGRYRSHEDPMQVVSGAIGNEKVHFEAPPSELMAKEMEAFVTWFNATHHKNDKAVLPLARAGIAHFYFETIHPFEDGNGRIGRALSEKSISMSLQRPALISLSHAIENNNKQYYSALEAHNQSLNLTEWLVFFGQTVLDALDNTLHTIEFLIEKAKFFDRYSGQMNDRQDKVVKRVFEAGHEGFTGGLSAHNYQRISRSSSSTASRDLKDLVDKGILTKTGELKGTRYWLNIKS